MEVFQGRISWLRTHGKSTCLSESSETQGWQIPQSTPLLLVPCPQQTSLINGTIYLHSQDLASELFSDTLLAIMNQSEFSQERKYICHPGLDLRLTMLDGRSWDPFTALSQWHHNKMGKFFPLRISNWDHISLKTSILESLTSQWLCEERDCVISRWGYETVANNSSNLSMTQHRFISYSSYMFAMGGQRLLLLCQHCLQHSGFWVIERGRAPVEISHLPFCSSARKWHTSLPLTVIGQS